MKKIFSGIMAATMLVTMAGCNKKASNDVTTITMWTGGTSSKSVVEKLVSEFNNTIGKENNIFFDYVVKEGDMSQQIELALASDQAPDIFFGGNVLKLADNGDVAALEDIPEAKELLEKYPFYLEASNGVAGKHYCLAHCTNTQGLIYNKDMFKAAGIVDENGEAKPPKTLKELRECASKLTDKSKRQFGIIFPAKWASFYWVDISNNSMPSSGRLQYDPVSGKYDFEALRPMLETVMGIKNDETCYPGADGLDNDAARARFAEGNIGMKFSVSWDVGVFNDQFPAKFDWGVAPIPVADENNRYKQLYNTGYSALINAKSVQDEEHRKKLMIVYNWFYSDDTLTKLFESGCEIPTNVDLIKKANKDNMPKGWAEFADLVEISAPAPVSMRVDLSGYENTSDDFIKNVWTNKITVDEFIANRNKIYAEGVEKYQQLHPEYDKTEAINKDWDIRLESK